MRTKLTLLLFGLFLSFSFNTYGELPFGAYAENWTLDEIPDNCDPNGTWGPTWELYADVLDQGKHAVIDFSATWCGPCWSYHQGGNLETLWEDHGPDGDNTIAVFYIEIDCSTNVQCLCGSSGCNGSTYGDWTAGTNFPMFSPSGSTCSDINNDYDITYFPTLYAINAEYRTVWEVSQASVATWKSWLFESFALAVEFDVIDDLCSDNGGSIDMSTTGGYNNLNFLWNTGAETEDLDDIGPGNYSVTITDGHGYFIVKDVDVYGNDDPIVIEEQELSDNLCYDGSDGFILLDVSGGEPGYSYEWSNGETTKDIYDLPVGYYTVTVTDDLDCENEQTYFVDEPEELVMISFTYDETCSQSDGAIIIDGEGGIGDYEYSIGGAYQDNGEFYNLAAGEYNASMRDENDCVIYEIIDIDGTDAPIVSAGDDKELTCTSNTVQLDGTGSATGSDITYLWTTTGGSIVSGETTTTPTVDASGTYVLEVTDGDNSCVSSDETIVTDDGNLPSIAIATPSDLSCTVSTTNLDASESENGSDYTYLWTTTDGNIVSGETSLIAVSDQAGTYIFSLTNTVNGCVSTKTVQVVADMDAAEFSSETKTITCAQTFVDLCVVVTSSYNEIIWTVSGDTSDCLNVTTAGDYEFTVYGTNGCTTIGTATADGGTELPTVAIQDHGALGCGTDLVELNATGSSNGSEYTYNWTTTDGNFTSGTDALIVTVDKEGTYQLEITNTFTNCVSSSSTIVTGGATMPNAGFTYNVDYNLVNLFGNVTPGATSSWGSGNMSESGDTAQFSFNDNGDYEICHFLENGCGVDTMCSTVTISGILDLSFTEEQASISCNAANDGSISITGQGGVGTYSITWSGPNGFSSNDFDISGLAPGDYSMVLIDGGNHSTTQTFTIAEPEAIAVSAHIISSNGDANDGSITLIISGGVAPFTYSWNNGSTDKDQSNLAEGDYSVVITDANGCSYTETYSVGISATNDPSFISAFDLYPNPAGNYTKVNLRFTSKLEGKLHLVDFTGKVIRTYSISDKETVLNINLQTLIQGVYLLKLESQNKVGVRKLIKL